MPQCKGSVKEGKRYGVSEKMVAEREAGIQCELCENRFTQDV